MKFNVAELALVYQALREAASVTRVGVRKEAYLQLAKRMKEKRDADARSVGVVDRSEKDRNVVRSPRGWESIEGGGEEGEDREGGS